MNVKKWLTEEEAKKLTGLLGYASVHSAMDASPVVEFAESLAESREEIANLKSNLEDYKYFVKQRNEKIAACRAIIEEALKAHNNNWIDSWFTANKERIAAQLKGVGGE